MNRALWKKSLSDVRWLLPCCAALMFCFYWLQVWITSQITLGQFRQLLGFLPASLKSLLPVPVEQLATVAGRMAIAYDHPLALLILAAWSIGRGSDAVSGEIDRGTMEMVLAQPVRRIAVLIVHAAVTVLGGAILAGSAWLGTTLGAMSVTLDEPVDVTRFVPAALSLLAMAFFLSGLTTLLSSADRYRWRTISLAGGFYVVEMIVRIVALSVADWRWLLNFTFFTPFDPEGLVARPETAWQWGGIEARHIWLGGLSCHGLLIGMGLVLYGLAAVVFCRRDLPAPL